MEGIFNILKSEGIEIPEETQKKLNKKIVSEYKSINEYNDLKKKLEESNNKISEFSNTQNEIDTLKQKNEELSKLYKESQLTGYKFQALKSGVNEKFVDFVTSEVMNNTNDTNDFNKALEAYNKDNPQFLTSNYKQNISVSTTPNISNKTQTQSNNDLMNRIIRGTYSG